MIARLTGLLCAFALSFAAYAQSGKVYRIGMLEIESARANRANMDALLRGLKEAGYTEGKNFVIDYRSADGLPDRFADLAAELARAKPDIIITRGSIAALAAKAATTAPIVMASSAARSASRPAWHRGESCRYKRRRDSRDADSPDRRT